MSNHYDLCVRLSYIEERLIKQRNEHEEAIKRIDMDITTLGQTRQGLDKATIRSEIMELI